MTREDREKLAPYIPETVYASEPDEVAMDPAGAISALRDAYFAALAGLQCSVQHKRGSREKLAYVVRRIEQYYETTSGTGLDREEP